MSIFDRFAERFELGILRTASGAHFFLIDAAHSVRVFRIDKQATGKILRLIFPFCFFPRRERRKRFKALIRRIELCDGLITPLYIDRLDPGLITFFYDHRHEFGLIESGLNEYGLSFFYVQARPCQ